MAYGPDLSKQPRLNLFYCSVCALFGLLPMTAHLFTISTRQQVIIDREHQRLPSKNHDTPPYKSSQMDYNYCQQLINGSEYNPNKTQLISKGIFPYFLDTMKSLRKCPIYLAKKRFITYITEEERNFPIAYSVLVYKDFSQFEGLLETIWRPHNVYCIHVDVKSPSLFHKAVHLLASCFKNVFIVSKSFEVKWGTFSVLQPELACMFDLWRHLVKWRYFINLTGQELPLKTNWEIVKILQAYNGTNDIFGWSRRANKNRWRGRPPAPHGITPMKGPVHVIASRDFVDYVLHSAVAQDFLNWIKDVKIPDESYFSTLNNNKQLKAPGHYKGDPELKTRRFMGRYKIWTGHRLPCMGKYVRTVCVFGVKDLPLLTKAKQLFANKFFSDYQPMTYECLRKWYFKKVEQEIHGIRKFDVTIYKQYAAGESPKF